MSSNREGQRSDERSDERSLEKTCRTSDSGVGFPMRYERPGDVRLLFNLVFHPVSWYSIPCSPSLVRHAVSWYATLFTIRHERPGLFL